MSSQRLLLVTVTLLVACSSQHAPQIGSSSPDGRAASLDSDHSPVNPNCPAQVPSYRNEIVPILQHRCLSCHGPQGSEGEDTPLYRYDALSKRRELLIGRLSAKSMPPAGAPPLSAADRERLICWAKSGAPDN